MTVPATGTWASSNATPQTQNTAPVLEFRCLYTSDLRRKQKRWQDGRLKFHTFNKRIMVYDDRSNFVGDSHWREDHAFAEGEEVELERCGILVEVSECVGTREQDLTHLLNKVVKDRQERTHVRSVASSLLQPPGPGMRAQTDGLSRAKSTDLRSAKRRKLNNSPSSKNGYVQNLTGATLALSGAPSIAAPLRYDPLWLRTMKQPIERVNIPESDGIHRVSREKSVAITKSQNKTAGSQAKRMSKRLSPACENSSYARNITGAALVLASKTPTSRRLPQASGMAGKATIRLGESGPTVITIEEDEFIDIDVYEKKNLPIEKTMEASSQVTNLTKIREQKSLLDALSDRPHPETDRDERPFNPLRIRTRPKSKLLLTVTPPSRPPSFTESSIEKSSGVICQPASPESRREWPLSLAPVPQAALVGENGPFDIKVHLSSSPLNAGMDHRGIDALLTRKVLGQTSMTEKLHANVQAPTKNKNSTQYAGESKEPTRLEGQERAQFNHFPGPQLAILQNAIRSPRQPLMLRGHMDGELEKDRTGPSKSFRSPPRLMKSFSEGAQASELRGLTIINTGEDINILKLAYQADRDVAVKRDVIPFRPPAKLTSLTTQSIKVSRRDNEQGGYDESVMPPIIASTKPAVPVPKAKPAREDGVANRDQGPWSREAFDLFDWRPGEDNTGDSLAVV